MFETLVVPRFGGGLNFSAHPAFIQDDEWSWGDGFQARNGTAEGMTAMVRQYQGSLWIPAGTALLPSLFPERMIAQSNRVLVAVRNTTTSAVRLFRFNPTGSGPTEIAVSGAAPTADAYTATFAGITWPTLIGGQQILAFGENSSASNYTMARYDASIFARLAPTRTLRGFGVCAAQQHALMIGRSGGPTTPRREIVVSEAGDATIWDAALGNSADAYLLDTANIAGMVPNRQGALVITDTGLFQLRVTGSTSPVFTVTQEAGVGATYFSGGPTPFGAVYQAGGLLFLEGGPAPGWHKVAQYLMGIGGRVAWHEHRQAAQFPAEAGARMLYDPVAGVWSRASIDVLGATVVDQEVDVGAPSGSWALTDTGDLYVENDPWSDIAGESYTGAFVDTKDFCFDDPTVDDYVDRIRVEWEPLTNTTDTIRVDAFARNTLLPNTTPGRTTAQPPDLTPNFVTLGTLQSGSGELPVRLRGKYIRFRFTQTSGRVRIRGFALRRQRGGDRVLG